MERVFDQKPVMEIEESSRSSFRTAEEVSRYSFRLQNENGKKRVWVDLDVLNIEKEKAQKITCEVEALKAKIEKILAE